MYKRHSIFSEASFYADLIRKYSSSDIQQNHKREGNWGSKERCFLGKLLLQVSLEPKQGCKSCEEVLGHSHQSFQIVGRGRQLAGFLRDDAIFTFFSLRAIKAPDLSSLICGSIRVVGSTKFSTPTSLTVHFWKTWTVETGEGKKKGEKKRILKRKEDWESSFWPRLKAPHRTVRIKNQGGLSSVFISPKKDNHLGKKWKAIKKPQMDKKGSSSVLATL